jgi:hypothetical protein
MDIYNYDIDRFENNWVFEAKKINNASPKPIFSGNQNSEDRGGGRTITRLVRDWLIFSILWSLVCFAGYSYITSNIETKETPVTIKNTSSIGSQNSEYCLINLAQEKIQNLL